MVLTYWHIGKRIVEQEQAGKERAKYGQALIEALADELTKEYGKSKCGKLLREIFAVYKINSVGGFDLMI